VVENRKITPHFIDVSSLGFISNCLDFTKGVKIAAMPDALKHKTVASAIKSSFDIQDGPKMEPPTVFANISAMI